VCLLHNDSCACLLCRTQQLRTQAAAMPRSPREEVSGPLSAALAGSLSPGRSGSAGGAGVAGGASAGGAGSSGGIAGSMSSGAVGSGGGAVDEARGPMVVSTVLLAAV
jgi:hypothetical protein